ncbi:hypothetical protein BpHYR1_002090 [Brachionus plicatilis]|uniref:Uncharacterized protein n=1 Tax=Brachionus plicatilis TaxID=10195 RepID=A0A3M7PC89_BRAPC|nr:hypothetical protein BpHYR1_002090 [Brachionus plicatilis]
MDHFAITLIIKKNKKSEISIKILILIKTNISIIYNVPELLRQGCAPDPFNFYTKKKMIKEEILFNSNFTMPRILIKAIKNDKNKSLFIFYVLWYKIYFIKSSINKIYEICLDLLNKSIFFLVKLMNIVFLNTCKNKKSISPTSNSLVSPFIFPIESIIEVVIAPSHRTKAWYSFVEVTFVPMCVSLVGIVDDT